MNQLKVIKMRNVCTLNMKMKVKKPTCNPLADPICTCMHGYDICMHFLDTTNSA